MGRIHEAETLFDRVEKLESTESIPEKQTIVETSPPKEQTIVETSKPQVPDWIRNNAKWWAEGTIGDNDFTSGIQFLIKEDIILIPETDASSPAGDSEGIPAWIKNNADWWSQGLISDEDFISGLKYMVEHGIIRV